MADEAVHERDGWVRLKVSQCHPGSLFQHPGSQLVCDDAQAICPTCGYDYCHPGEPYSIGSGDYSTGTGYRGHLYVQPFEGECGHEWRLCIASHKGNAYVWVEVKDREDGED